jgi:hypothetical protein
VNQPRESVARRARWTALALAAGVLACPGAAWAANDRFVDAAPLGYGIPAVASNVGATIEPNGESMTVNGFAPNYNACYFTNPPHATQTGSTLWWKVEGSGRLATISDAGSSIDTVLGLFFHGPTDTDYQCEDAPTGLTESFSFATTAGQPYWIQIGGCHATDPPGGCNGGGVEQGTIHALVTSPAAANDNKGSAAALATGQQTEGDTYAATEEPGEPVVCASHGGQSPYGRTVWYRWHAPSDGHAVFGVTSVFDNVLAVYRDGSAAPLMCDDDPNRAGPSRIEMNVTAGDYLLQVAGYGAHNAGASQDSASGAFTVSAEFAATPPNPDRDGDGVKNESDCQPDNPKVYPGAKDKPGNGIDENCDHRDARLPVLKIDPPPKVKSVGLPRGIKIVSVSIKLPRGTKVTLRCSRHACRSSTKTVPGRGSRRRTFVVKGLKNKVIRRNQSFSLYLVRTGYRGVYLRYRNTRGELTSSKRCLVSGGRKFTSCS